MLLSGVQQNVSVIFSSIIGYYKILSTVFNAIQQILLYTDPTLYTVMCIF